MTRPFLTVREGRAWVRAQNAADREEAEGRRYLLLLGVVLAGLAACGVLGMLFGGLP